MLRAVIHGDRLIRLTALLLAGILLLTLRTECPRPNPWPSPKLTGTCTDPSGQAIVGATVKMTEMDKQQVRTTSTDVTGRFALPNLPVGAYRLEVTSAGFKAYIQTGIVLQVASNIEIPVTLQIGAVTESITVTANAAMVETKENSIAQVIDQQRIEDLPLNGRNPTQLLTLSGGTSQHDVERRRSHGQQEHAGIQRLGPVFRGRRAGQRRQLPAGRRRQQRRVQQREHADSVPGCDPGIQRADQRTCRRNTGCIPAAWSTSSPSRAATRIHGNLFEYLRNGDLNARPDGVAGLQPVRDSLKRSQYGGTVGGKIIRDKLFFFAGYQGTRQRSDPAANTAYVPTAAALQGRFQRARRRQGQRRLPGDARAR